ncbi:MAG TPA: T9SS type A sorting domain-containing protein [Bacteroidia bacterium]|nr:T9SS type A sorting domain-containing protein [Bacteroidia bacterium]
MKKILLIFNFIFLIFTCPVFFGNSAFSQAGMWTWIHGDTIPDSPGNFGIQGIPSPLNTPPGIYEACEWTDLNGNFWLFGGNAGPGGLGAYGALWKYEPSINIWTWIKGSSMLNDTGSYGLQGIPSVTNAPPSRSWGAATWTDLNGDFWLYGGTSKLVGTSSFCGRGDLWKYNIASNTWTWMQGSPSCSSYPYYGTIGIPSPSNTPGSRNEFSATWVDSSNNLWMFSGRGSNDLWKYTISSNEWTMVKGDTLPAQPAVYGTMGVPDPLNIPGGRYPYCTWKDKNEKFWLFGGLKVPFGYNLNDMWMYDPLSNNWTWMSGTNLTNQAAITGAFCDASANYIPASRFENRARWTDACGKFWMYGGSHTNDLWYFNPVTLEWSMINGDPTNQFFHSAIYGTMGVPSPLNQPGSRSGSVSWISNNGELYHFGGTDILDRRNDLWKYVPDTNCGGCNMSTSIRENNTTKELLIFPNPANPSLTISFQSSSNQTIELRIYNTLGKQIYVEKEEITQGKFEKEINVEKLGSGIYFLQLKTKEGNINRKVIINH